MAGERRPHNKYLGIRLKYPIQFRFREFYWIKSNSFMCSGPPQTSQMNLASDLQINYSSLYEHHPRAEQIGVYGALYRGLY